jgi:hypothetical protein
MEEMSLLATSWKEKVEKLEKTGRWKLKIVVELTVYSLLFSVYSFCFSFRLFSSKEVYEVFPSFSNSPQKKRSSKLGWERYLQNAESVRQQQDLSTIVPELVWLSRYLVWKSTNHVLVDTTQYTSPIPWRMVVMAIC